jgi:hypothetical protein
MAASKKPAKKPAAKKAGRVTPPKRVAKLELPAAQGPKTEVEGIHGREMTAAEVFGLKKPTRFTQPICLDSELADARDEARAAVEQINQLINLSVAFGRGADEGMAKKLEAAQRHAHLAEAAAAPVTALFVFEDIGRVAYSRLIRSFPASPEQIEAHAVMLKKHGRPFEVLPYDPDRFPPALVAACAKAPALTAEEAGWIWDGRPEVLDDDGDVVQEAEPPWSEGECGALFDSALAACRAIR